MEQEKETKKQEGFDYKHKASFKISNKFKQYFSTKTAGGDTISSDGLVALAHVKGLWKIDSEIIQFPNTENNNTCICRATVGGYDWDPIEEKLIRVEYTDIGDASPTNCNRMVAPSFIRMASTRAIGRALRKYLNIDMLCTEELTDDDVSTDSMEAFAVQEPPMDLLNQAKALIVQKNIPQDICMQILNDTCHTSDFMSLTRQQAQQYLNIISNYIPTKQ